MQSWTPVVEPPLHGAPRESVVAVEPAQRLELGDPDHRGYKGVDIEMQEVARRRERATSGSPALAASISSSSF